MYNIIRNVINHKRHVLKEFIQTWSIYMGIIKEEEKDEKNGKKIDNKFDIGNVY